MYMDDNVFTANTGSGIFRRDLHLASLQKVLKNYLLKKLTNSHSNITSSGQSKWTTTSTF